MTLKRIHKICTEKIDGTGIGLFRILYSFVLLCEVIQLFKFRRLVFDRVPFLVKHEVDFTVPLIIWMITLIFVMIGFKTRIAAICNYLFSLCIISTLKTYEYHMFYIYMGVNFVMLFLSINRNLAIDSFLYRARNQNFSAYVKISAINHFMIGFVGIALVYFDSIFHKFASNLWTSGLGVWLPSSIPQVSIRNLYWLLNSKSIMIFLGYFTLLFEVIFIFLFTIRRFRPYLFVIGIGLHIGITIFYPIPWFGLGMCAIYLTLFPNAWLLAIRNKLFKNKQAVVNIDQSKEGILIGAILKTFDFSDSITIKRQSDVQLRYDAAFYRNVFKLTRITDWISRLINNRTYNFFIAVKTYVLGLFSIELPPKNPLFLRYQSKMIYLFVVSLIFLQTISVCLSPVFYNFYDKTGLTSSKLVKKALGGFEVIEDYSKILLGITKHGVFVDSHFEKYNHVIALEYDNKKIWLPIINKDGAPGDYLNGFTWAKWSFRTNNPTINQQVLANGIRDFSIYWMKKNNIDTDSAVFNVKVKVIESTDEWQQDFLKNQREKEWVDGGSVMWIEDEFIDHIKDIESIQ